MDSLILNLFQSDVSLITLLIMSYEDIKQSSMSCVLYTGENAVEINTEADSNDMTECPYDDKPTTGVFHFPDSIFSALILFVVFALLSCCCS